MNQNNTGILLANIGTPDYPTPAAVRCYLHEFLSDRRVVEIPRLLWWPMLYGLILPLRAKKSAALYQKIWTPQGSPLLQHSLRLTAALEEKLQLPVALGMHYGNPSIKSALHELQQKKIDNLIVLPLYPQYSATTTASTFDHVAQVLKSWRYIPNLHFITDYADHSAYIQAIAQSIRTAQERWGKPQRLIFSFHGIPKRFVQAGDPYQTRCETTTRLIAEALQLKPEDYLLTFQSRLGRAEWLQPYTNQTLMRLGKEGIEHVHVVCPGFAVDCLETLEEIALQGKKQFLAAGGKRFEYIPALNDQPEQVEMLSALSGKFS